MKALFTFDGDRIILYFMIGFIFLFMIFGRVEVEVYGPCASVKSWRTKVINDHCYVIVTSPKYHEEMSVRLDLLGLSEEDL